MSQLLPHGENEICKRHCDVVLKNHCLINFQEEKGWKLLQSHVLQVPLIDMDIVGEDHTLTSLGPSSGNIGEAGQFVTYFWQLSCTAI